MLLIQIQVVEFVGDCADHHSMFNPQPGNASMFNVQKSRSHMSIFSKQEVLCSIPTINDGSMFNPQQARCIMFKPQQVRSCMFIH